MENMGLALTDLFLGLTFMLYAKYSWQVPTPIPLLRNNVTWLYVSLSSVCLLSFFMFGFYNIPEGKIHGYIQQSILISFGFVLYFMLTILLTLQMPSTPRKARALLLTPTLIYILLTFEWPTFTYSNIILIPSLLGFLFLMLKMYLSTKNTQLFIGIVSVFALGFLTLFQNYLINITSVFFFFLYTPLVLFSAFALYRGIALFLNKKHPSGLYNIITNNRLNYLTSTSMRQVFTPKTTEGAQEDFKCAKENNQTLSFQSSGYSIGGQDLIQNGTLIHTRKLNQIELFDSVNGWVKTGPSMTWQKLRAYLNKAQKEKPNSWALKQLPCHFLDYSLGGAISANTHGNNLFCSPLIKDILAIDLIDASGKTQRVDRKSNQALFSLAIGGYGLFGLVTGIELNLSKKRILQKNVETIMVKDLESKIKQHAESGALNLEFVLNTNESDRDFLQNGILSSYHPIEANPKSIQFEPYHTSIFNKNALDAHFPLFINNKTKKIELQNKLLLAKNECYYWSNNITPYFSLEKNLKLVHLLFPEYQDYHLIKHEYYLPINKIVPFLNKLNSNKKLRSFYLIEAILSVTKQDEESFLHWSNQDYIALKLSFHTHCSAQSLIHLKEYLTELTESAIHLNGSFSLGYTHPYEKSHLLKCYPKIIDFLTLKLQYDPGEVLQSNWYHAIKKQLEIN